MKEIEVTLKVKFIGENADFLPISVFRRNQNIISANIVDKKINEISEKHKLKQLVYNHIKQSLEGEERLENGTAYICDWCYGKYNDDPNIYLLEDHMKSRCISLIIFPKSEEEIYLTCNCLENEFKKKCSLKTLPEEIINFLSSHTCQPWPG